VRISSASINRHAIQDLMKYQLEMAELQSRISSGKRLNKPSDDPVDVSRKIDVSASLSQVGQYIRNINFAEARLENEENHLSNSENILLRVRELALISNNAATSSNDYPAIKAELVQLRGDLLSQANAKDVDGNYIFSGSKTATRPLNPGSTNTYNGDDQPRLIQVNQNLQMQTSDSGKDIFMRIPQSDLSHTLSASSDNTGSAVGVVADAGIGGSPGNDRFSIQFTSPTSYDIVNLSTGTIEVSAATLSESRTIDLAGMQVTLTGAPSANDEFLLIPTQQQDIFTTLDSFIGLLEKTPSSTAQKTLQHQDINSVLLNVDQAFEHFTLKRAEIGSRLASLDIIRTENEASEFQLKTTLSGIQDLDYTEAISSLQQHAFALEALQQTIVRTQGLSLFNN